MRLAALPSHTQQASSTYSRAVAPSPHSPCLASAADSSSEYIASTAAAVVAAARALDYSPVVEVEAVDAAAVDVVARGVVEDVVVVVAAGHVVAVEDAADAAAVVPR